MGRPGGGEPGGAHRQRRQHHPQRRPPDARPGSARLVERAAVDRRLLRDRLRRACSSSGGAWRTASGARRFFLIGLSVFAVGIGRCRVLGLRRSPDRLPGRDGNWRGPHHPRVAVHHQRRLPGPGPAGPRHRRLGRDDRARDRHRPDRRRPASLEVLVGVDLPREHPDRPHRAWSVPLLWFRTRRTRHVLRPDPVGALLVDRGPRPPAVGDHRGPDPGVDLGDRGRASDGQPDRPGRLRGLGIAQLAPHAQAGVLPRPPLLRRPGGRSASPCSA